MGAAVSVQKVYQNGFAWFKRYFDETMYIEDFRAIDKDHNGGISLKEFENWIHGKAKHCPNNTNTWGFLLSSPEIIKIAHKQAGQYRPDLTVKPGEKIVDVADFRNLLIHLYAISVLWVHFKNADDWAHSEVYGNKLLTFDEFRLACHTITEAHAHEKLSEEQILHDFHAIEKKDPLHLTFLEVCNYCCKFIDKLEDNKMAMYTSSSKVSTKTVSAATTTATAGTVTNYSAASVSTTSTQSSSEVSTPSATLVKEASIRALNEQANQSMKGTNTRSSQHLLTQRSQRFQSMLLQESMIIEDEDALVALPQHITSASIVQHKAINGFQEEDKDEHHGTGNDNELILPNDVIVLSRYIEDHIKKDLNTRSSVKINHQFNTLDAKTELAIEALGEQLNNNKAVAEFAEVKFNTEHEIHKMLYGQN